MDAKEIGHNNVEAYTKTIDEYGNIATKLEIAKHSTVFLISCMAVDIIRIGEWLHNRSIDSLNADHATFKLRKEMQDL